jgi:FdhD protein
VGAGDPRVAKRPITRVTAAGRKVKAETLEDAVTVERPLEIRVGGRSLVVTLRTPGDDRELALGFLAGEGLIGRRDQVASIETTEATCADDADTLDLELAPGVTFDWTRLERHFASTAACGLCGRAHLESLRAGLTPMMLGPAIEAAALAAVPERMKKEQAAFTATGGLHAAAFLTDGLEPEVLREDVGRHNAVDKVAGWLLERGRYPARTGVLWVSGRAGAEIALKAARARIPILAAVGAPSTMAIEIAHAGGMTLVAFLREGRMNVYQGAERIAIPRK